MNDWITGLIVLAVWIVLQFIIFRKIGVPT
jgi:hypothetical protein